MQVKDPDAVKRWRKMRNLTQRDLAYLCRCSQNTISLIERGAMPTLSQDLAFEIAKRLSVPWEELFLSRSTPGVRRAANDRSATGHQEAISA